MNERIDKQTLAFVIPIFDNGEVFTFYIPAPTEERADAASPVLGALFSLKEKSQNKIVLWFKNIFKHIHI